MLILLMELIIILPLKAETRCSESLALVEVSDPVLENEVLRKRNEILINLLIETEAREKRRDLTVAKLEARIAHNEETITMQQALLGMHPSKGAFGMTSKKKAIEVQAINFGANPKELISMVQRVKDFEEGTLVRLLLDAVVKNLKKEGHTIGPDDTLESIKNEQTNSPKKDRACR